MTPSPETIPILIGLSKSIDSRLLLNKKTFIILIVEKKVIIDRKRKKSLFKFNELVNSIKKNIEITKTSEVNKMESKILLEKKEVMIKNRFIIINILEKPEIPKFLSVKTDLRLNAINIIDINRKYIRELFCGKSNNTENSINSSISLERISCR